MVVYGAPFTRNCPYCGVPIEAAIEPDWNARYADHLYGECHHRWPGEEE